MVWTYQQNPEPPGSPDNEVEASTMFLNVPGFEGDSRVVSLGLDSCPNHLILILIVIIITITILYHETDIYIYMIYDYKLYMYVCIYIIYNLKCLQYI